mgnify:CR=1 FL=1
MTDIPEDIMREAESLATELPMRVLTDPDSVATTIALALYAAEKRGAERERERCVVIADEHLSRIVGHHPDKPMADQGAQGYGNAALNIAAAIRRGEE